MAMHDSFEKGKIRVTRINAKSGVCHLEEGLLVT